MRALTLWQPWATLIAIGAKTMETRHWATAYRGPLLIHAGKTCAPWQDDPPFARLVRAALEAAGLDASAPLPAGSLLAVVTVAGCVPVELALPSPQERRFGNFTAGRYAWLLADVRPFDPIAAPGKQGLWECPVPLG